MTSCDSVSTNLGEGQIRLNSFNESKLDLNQAFKPPKLTAKAPRPPSRRMEAGSSGCGDHVFDLVPEEQGTTENTEHTEARH